MSRVVQVDSRVDREEVMRDTSVLRVPNEDATVDIVNEEGFLEFSLRRLKMSQFLCILQGLNIYIPTMNRLPS